MDNYEVIEYLGKGSFGCVSKIRRREDGQVLVWKEISYGEMKDREKQYLVNEVNILQKLKHPNIVRYYDRIIDKEKSKIYIIMEYCTGGDLGQLIQKCKEDRKYIEEEIIWKCLVQVLSALYEIHNRKDGVILHRDIKPGNLFLDQQSNIKLGDFGLAKILSNDTLHAHTFVGTPHYMSPEQLSPKPSYNDRSDVWSVGCLAYEMATLRPPFHEATTHTQLYARIKEGVYDPIPRHYSRDLSHVISLMLTQDTSNRPSVEALMNHFPPLTSRIKEKKLQMMYSNLKNQEEEIRHKERILIERENHLAKKEQQLIQKEQQLIQKEQQLRLYEQKLLQQYKQLSSGKENIDQNKINNSNNNTNTCMQQQQQPQPQQQPQQQPSSQQQPLQQQPQPQYQTTFTQLKRVQTLPVSFK